MPKELKVFKFDLKTLDEEGIFTGYAAVFNNVDLGGDVIEPGSFKRTIDHNKGKFPILSAHDPTVEVGMAEVKEDRHGLHVTRGELYIAEDIRDEIPEARKSYIRMKKRQEHNRPMGMSIGYEVKQGEPREAGGRGRRLREIKLWEVSVDVTFPMNPLAAVTTVKDHTFDFEESIVVADLIKAEGFARTFAQLQVEEDLSEERWKIDRAFWRSITSILVDENVDNAGKIDMIKTSLTQFAQAMLAWAQRFVVAITPLGDEGDSIEFFSNPAARYLEIMCDVIERCKDDIPGALQEKLLKIAERYQVLLKLQPVPGDSTDSHSPDNQPEGPERATDSKADPSNETHSAVTLEEEIHELFQLTKQFAGVSGEESINGGRTEGSPAAARGSNSGLT